MAFINCPKCGESVSSNAPKCPYCGFPVSAFADSMQGQAAQPLQDQKKVLVLGVIVALLVLFGAVMALYIGNVQQAEKDQQIAYEQEAAHQQAQALKEQERMMAEQMERQAMLQTMRAAFDSIQPGMSFDQVAALLGPNRPGREALADMQGSAVVVWEIDDQTSVSITFADNVVESKAWLQD